MSAPPFPGRGAPGDKQRLRGRIPLLLALIFGVVGLVLIAVGSVVLAQGALGKVDDFARVPLDGSPHAVQLTRTGDYVGYYEEPRLDTSRRVPDGRLAITGPGGRAVAVRDTGATTDTYDVDGHHGVAVVEFTITSAGRYTVTGQPANTSASSPGLALGESVVTGVVVAGVAMVVPGVLLLIAAVVLLIVGLARRRKHKRALEDYYRAAYPG